MLAGSSDRQENVERERRSTKLIITSRGRNEMFSEHILYFRSLKHLERPGTYVRVMFIDFRSEFLPGFFDKPAMVNVYPCKWMVHIGPYRDEQCR